MSSAARPVLRELTDTAEILPILDAERLWAAFALCDLDPPHRQYSTFLGLERGGTEGAVLVYRPPGFTALIPFGDESTVTKILAGMDEPPASPVLLIRKEDRNAVGQRYEMPGMRTMIRMCIQGDGMRVPKPVDASITVLADADVPTLESLYSGWPETHFQRTMLHPRMYCGVWDGDELIAAAGTHVISPGRGIGVVGNVYVRPEWRGRRLGTAATGRVCHELFNLGIRDIVLNVFEENLPAVHSYESLGFQRHMDFYEGLGVPK